MSTHERRIVSAIVAVLLGTAIWFRLLRLGSVPGLSGDEGWWGVQALAWLAGRPYEPRTTSGNPIDLLFLVPVALLHAIASPSFALLRLVPVLANVLALVAAFGFGRRLFGETMAWIHTVTLAVLPTAIAHSRICQDPSQSVFWSGLVVYLALLGVKERGMAGRWLAAAIVLFPLALWTHPTNVFVAPFLLLPIAPPLAPRMPAAPRAPLRRPVPPPADRRATRRTDAGVAAGPHRRRHRHGGGARGRPDCGMGRLRHCGAGVSVARQALAGTRRWAPRRRAPGARVRGEHR